MNHMIHVYKYTIYVLHNILKPLVTKCVDSNILYIISTFILKLATLVLTIRNVSQLILVLY